MVGSGAGSPTLHIVKRQSIHCDAEVSLNVVVNSLFGILISPTGVEVGAQIVVKKVSGIRCFCIGEVTAQLRTVGHHAERTVVVALQSLSIGEEGLEFLVESSLTDGFFEICHSTFINGLEAEAVACICPCPNTNSTIIIGIHLLSGLSVGIDDEGTGLFCERSFFVDCEVGGLGSHGESISRRGGCACKFVGEVALEGVNIIVFAGGGVLHGRLGDFPDVTSRFYVKHFGNGVSTPTEKLLVVLNNGTPVARCFAAVADEVVAGFHLDDRFGKEFSQFNDAGAVSIHSFFGLQFFGKTGLSPSTYVIIDCLGFSHEVCGIVAGVHTGREGGFGRTGEVSHCVSNDFVQALLFVHGVNLMHVGIHIAGIERFTKTTEVGVGELLT